MDPVENVAASRAAHQGDNARLRQLLDGLIRQLPSPPQPRVSDEQA